MFALQTRYTCFASSIYLLCKFDMNLRCEEGAQKTLTNFNFEFRIYNNVKGQTKCKNI